MTNIHEQGTTLPQDRVLHAKWNAVRSMKGFLAGIDDIEAHGYFDYLTRHGKRFDIVGVVGTERYYQDGIQALSGKDDYQKHAIDIATLAPGVRMVLSLMPLYPLERREPRLKQQAVIYYLDESVGSLGNIALTAVNYVFMIQMAQALLNRRYQLIGGEKSDDFKAELQKALEAAGRFVARLPDEEKEKLPAAVLRLGTMRRESLRADLEITTGRKMDMTA